MNIRFRLRRAAGLFRQLPRLFLCLGLLHHGVTDAGEQPEEDEPRGKQEAQNEQ